MNKILKSTSNFVRYLVLGVPYFYHKYLILLSHKWTAEKCENFGNERFKKKLLKFGKELKSKNRMTKNLRELTILGNNIFCKNVSTGGTTGTPFSFKMNRFYNRQKERAYLHNIWSEIGYKPFDTIVAFRGNFSDRLISYNWIDNSFEISVDKVNKSNAEILFQRLKKINGFYLHVYPSSLYTFIDLIGEKAFRELSIKGILAGSEKFLLEKMHVFEKKYKIPISHWYGQSEYVSLAKHCRNCNGFHFYPTYSYTEFIPNKNSDFYSIIATSFHHIGTNFVRYDTEDLVELDKKKCIQPFRRVKDIIGRQEEYFFDSEGVKRAFGPFLFGIHNDFWEKIRNIQFIQNIRGFLIVKIVLVDDRYYNWIKNFIEERFNFVEIDFEIVDSIDKTISGKHKYFLNNIRK